MKERRKKNNIVFLETTIYNTVFKSIKVSWILRKHEKWRKTWKLRYVLWYGLMVQRGVLLCFFCNCYVKWWWVWFALCYWFGWKDSVRVCVCVVLCCCCMKRTRKRSGVGIDEEGFKIKEKIALFGRITRRDGNVCEGERWWWEQRKGWRRRRWQRWDWHVARNGGPWRYTRVDYEEKIERWRERIWVFSRMHCHGTEILVSRLVSFFYFLL